MSVADRVKILLTSVYRFLHKFCPKLPTRVDFSIGNIRWQIATEWLEIAQWSQWLPIGNYHRSFK